MKNVSEVPLPGRASASILQPLIDSFRLVADQLPDPRTGPNTLFSVADAALSVLAAFFLQSPSFLRFQRQIEHRRRNSNCRTLFGMRSIPSDNCIRNLLDGVGSAAFQPLFAALLGLLRERGGLAPFLRLDRRILVALDGTQIHASYKIHCPHCSCRQSGSPSAPKTQYFHSMLGAAVVADGHNLALPLAPEFIQPQDDPGEAGSTPEERKQDCESNAAKRWLSKHIHELRPFRAVFLGDDLFCCQPLCRLVLDGGADFLFVAKPTSHQRFDELLHEDFISGSGWLRGRHPKTRRVEYRRFRWMAGLPVRDSDDAVEGTWIEYAVEVDDPKAAGGRRRTYTNSFFTSLAVTRDNVARIAAAGRARWKVENETFNCLKNHGYHLEHHFGHGRDGLANTLVAINLYAFALHTVLDCLCVLWQRCRQRFGTRGEFFQMLSSSTYYFLFPTWRSLLETLLEERPPPGSAAAAPA